MFEIWKRKKPSQATFRALLEMLERWRKRRLLHKLCLTSILEGELKIIILLCTSCVVFECYIANFVPYTHSLPLTLSVSSLTDVCPAPPVIDRLRLYYPIAHSLLPPCIYRSCEEVHIIQHSGPWTVEMSEQNPQISFITMCGCVCCVLCKLLKCFDIP